MRTTLTLENDVAVRLKKAMEERDSTFKAIVNEALRRGLDVLDTAAEQREPYVLIPFSSGDCLLPDLDDTADVLAVAEGEDFK